MSQQRSKNFRVSKSCSDIPISSAGMFHFCRESLLTDAIHNIKSVCCFQAPSTLTHPNHLRLG